MATPSDYEKPSHGRTIDQRKTASDFEKSSYPKQNPVRGDGPPPKSEG